MKNRLDELADAAGEKHCDAMLGVVPNNQGGVMLTIYSEKNSDGRRRVVAVDLPFDATVEFIKSIERIIYGGEDGE